jgi:hypothetical protein
MISKPPRPDTYFARPPEIEMIWQMARESTAKEPSPPPLSDPKDAFIIKPAGDWLVAAKQQPETAMLFDRFWFEGELCILFADTNVGKSVLAVQIGDSISRGEPVGNFMLKAAPCTVLYIDFELTTRQFETRYSDGVHGHYRFGKNFLRAEINPAATGARKFGTYEAYIENALENMLITTKAKVLMIDNITSLHNGTHAAKGALTLMKNLQQLKRQYQVSILVLAHTPKRNPCRPVNRNDLQGSKMLLNFCDSAFAIGESQTHTGVRYLKQIKQRNGTETYGMANICLGQISKRYNFVEFDFTGFAHETDHLLPYNEQYRKRRDEKIIVLHTQGKSLREIATTVGTGASTVLRVVNEGKG